MRKITSFQAMRFWFSLCAAGALVGASAVARPVKYKADDGRTISIGTSSPAYAGEKFKEPHMEKCWLANGFDFKGYDVLYIAPILSTAKYHPDEEMPHGAAMSNLLNELNGALAEKGIFARVVTRAIQEIKPGARARSGSPTPS